MILMIFRLLLVAGVAVATFAYYNLILPAAVAGFVAGLVALVALFGLISSQMKFHGWIFGGAVFATWPAGALLARYAAGLAGLTLTPTQALAWAWVAALLAAKATYAMAEKRDKARDLGGLALGVVAIYGVGAAAWHSDRWALVGASLGAAAVAIHVKQALILPPRQERFLTACASAGAVAVALHAGRALVGL